VNLSEVVESALLFLRRTLLDAGIVVETQATNAFCWVAGDGAQLQIAVANLLRNALEALLSAATVEPRIAVTLRRDGGALELEVADNGPGLPPCLLDDNPVVSSGAKGMGVGLSVVQITRENHGGTLRQGRSPQGGATAILRLPALSTPPSGLSYL
jgi:C4-dicarboxylate-specific signal transduction histidine kinase